MSKIYLTLPLSFLILLTGCAPTLTEYCNDRGLSQGDAGYSQCAAQYDFEQKDNQAYWSDNFEFARESEQALPDSSYDTDRSIEEIYKDNRGVLRYRTVMVKAEEKTQAKAEIRKGHDRSQYKDDCMLQKGWIGIGKRSANEAHSSNIIVTPLYKSDQVYAAQQAANVSIGQSIQWNNPKTGNSGAITPTRDGRSADGRYCREYQQTTTVGGKQQSAYGAACRQPDGSWQVTN